MDSQLSAAQGNAIIVQLALIQDDLIEKEHRVTPLQQLNGNLLLRRRLKPLQLRVVGIPRRAAVRRRVAPVVGLDHLFNALRGALARALPVARIGHAQHVLVGLVDGVEGIGGVELEGPVGGSVRDGDEVVAKDHLRHGDAELLLEGIDGGGLGDGQLAGRDAEAVLRVGGCGGGEGVGAGEGFVEGGDVVCHFL